MTAFTTRLMFLVALLSAQEVTLHARVILPDITLDAAQFAIDVRSNTVSDTEYFQLAPINHSEFVPESFGMDSTVRAHSKPSEVYASADLREAWGSIAGFGVIDVVSSLLFSVAVVPTGDGLPLSSEVPIIYHLTSFLNCSSSGGLLSRATASAKAIVGSREYSADCDSPKLNVITTSLFPVNQPVMVSKTAHAHVTASYLQASGSPYPYGRAKATAWLDPVFTIDPSFPFAEHYQLIYSSGIEIADVPEPSTAATVAAFVAFVVLNIVRKSLTNSDS